MTPTELKIAALVRLQVAGSGEDVDPDDFALMGTKYTALHAALLKKRLVTWAVTESIPIEAQEPVAAMIAAMSVNEFSIPEARKAALVAEGALDLPNPSLAERQLRKALSQPYVSTRLRTTYY